MSRRRSSRIIQCSPDAPNGVEVEHRVGAHDFELLEDGLGNDHAIERVTMVVRKADQFCRVARLNRQEGEAVVVNCLLNERCKWNLQCVFAGAQLDGNFPVARGADENLVSRVGDCGFRCGAETRIIEVMP